MPNMGNDERNNLENQPLVSIILITYNHEKYIRQAVDSILNQTMNFTFELIVTDDASTDGTQRILADNYGEKENVRLILREKNIGGKNSYLAFQEARGKYIYVCEGDDYWCGTNGLQKLADWLENHKEYVGVCGRRISLSEKTGHMFLAYDKNLDHRDITLDDFLGKEIVFDRCAILYRNFYHDGKYDYRSYRACRTVGDVTALIYILLHGKVRQLDTIVGVYRTDRIRNSGSYNVTHTPKMIFEDHIMLLANLDQLFGLKLDYIKLKKRYTRWYVDSLSSTYEFIRQLPYVRKKVGIRITIECAQRWMDKIKNGESL